MFNQIKLTISHEILSRLDDTLVNRIELVPISSELLYVYQTLNRCILNDVKDCLLDERHLDLLMTNEMGKAWKKQSSGMTLNKKYAKGQ